MKDEVWKEIPGFPKYQISTYGRIKSYRTKASGHLIKQHLRPKGYWFVNIMDENNGMKNVFAHRLVLYAFVGPCPDGMEAAHLDGNPGNAHLENLKWISAKENARHKIAHGTHQFGSKHGRAKLIEDQVTEIRTKYADGKTITNLAKEYGVSRRSISNIVYNKLWKHLLDSNHIQLKEIP